MKKILLSRKGEMYIDSIITVIIIISLLLFSLSTLRIVSVKNTADSIADQLLETAAFYGCFGTEFDSHVADLQAKYSNLSFTVTYDGDWYNEEYERVQLGDSMSLTLHYEVTLGGFGSFITIPLTSVRSAASENFWKTSTS